MRGITLHEPWSSLIACGIKNWETRSWKTHYRGLILIHSGQRFPKKHEVLHLRKSVIHPEAGRALSTDYKDNMGCIIAIATLSGCILMTEELIDSIDETELFCGNWQPGRYAWKLTDVQRIKPIPFKGKQRLWIPSPEVVTEVARYTNQTKKEKKQ